MARPKKQTTTSKKVTQIKSAMEKRAGTPVAEAVTKQDDAPSRRKRLSREFRKQQRADFVRKPVISGPKLFSQAARLLKVHWRLFLGIMVVYLILNVILVGGLSSSTDINSLKSSLNQVFTGHLGRLSTGLTLFTVLVGSIGNGGTTAVAGAYQTILLLLISVILIWALRQVYAKNPIRVRDAFYQGVYPLIPFVLVLLFIGLELVPLIIGGTIYSAVIGGGIATSLLEQILTVIVFLGLAVSSIYMLCSSIFALYIVTLPNMEPLQALRSAREVVKYRRWIVLRKVLFLPVALIAIGAVIMVPISLYITPAATAIFFALTVLGIAMIHSYMYALYRELL